MDTKSINFVHGLVTHLSSQHLEMLSDTEKALRVPSVTYKKETSMMTDTLTKNQAQDCVHLFY